MADKPQLPRGDGGGNLSDALNSMTDILGSISGQLASVTSLQSDFSAFADLWLEMSQMNTDFNKTLMDSQDVLVDTNRLVAENTFKSAKALDDINVTLKNIQEFLAPISAHFAELLEDTNTAPRQTIEPTVGAGGGRLGGGFVAAEQKQKDGGFGNGMAGFLGAMMGGKGGGAVGAAVGGGIAGFFSRVGVGLGIFGIGLAAITGALYLGAKAVEVYGEGLSDVAKGLDDLNKIELDEEKFVRLGKAISSMANQIEVSGAIGLLIASQTNFAELAKGLEILDKTKFDQNKIITAGQTLNRFIDDVGSQWFDSITLSTLSDNLEEVSTGIVALSKASTQVGPDFIDKMELMGQGLGEFIDGLGAQWLDAGTISSLGSNFDTIAQGLFTIAQVNPGDDFEDRMTTLGKGLANLLDETGGFTGNRFDMGTFLGVAKGLQEFVPTISTINTTDTELFKLKAIDIGEGLNSILSGTDWKFWASQNLQYIDDNLIPLAAGVNSVAQANAEAFLQKAQLIGPGLNAILTGTDWKFWAAQSLQYIDDNLTPLAAGIDKIALVDAQSFLDKSALIGPAISNILTPFLDPKMEDIYKLSTFTDVLEDVGPAIQELGQNVDADMLLSLSELVKYASNLLTDGSIKSLADSLDLINKSSRGLSDEGDFPENYQNFSNFLNVLQRLAKEVDISRLERLGIAVSRIAEGSLALNNASADQIKELSTRRDAVAENQQQRSIADMAAAVNAGSAGGGTTVVNNIGGGAPTRGGSTSSNMVSPFDIGRVPLYTG